MQAFFDYLYNLNGTELLFSIMSIVVKHAPSCNVRIKGPDNPGFIMDPSDVMHKRNTAWTRAHKAGLEADWLNFRKF